MARQAPRVSGARVRTRGGGSPAISGLGHGRIVAANPRARTIRSTFQGSIGGSRGRAQLLKSGSRAAHGLVRGAAAIAKADTGTVGGVALVGAGGLVVGAAVEAHHSHKALTAAQLQQRRMAAKSHRTHQSGRP